MVGTSTVTIHPTAVVSPEARLATPVSVGPYSVLEDDVEVGKGCVLGPHVILRNGSRLGKRCRIHAGAVIGDDPQDLSFQPCRSYVVLGDDNVVREHATIHRGTTPGSVTCLGDHNYIMAGAHVAHNCRLGHHVILANNVLLAGYVEVDDYAFLSGGVVVHQYCRIGKLAMIGGNGRVPQDVPPYVLAAGYNVRVRGLNLLGLKRHGLSAERVRSLKKAYRLLYRSQLALKEALERIEREVGTEEALHLASFIRSSKRGFCRE